MLGLVAEPMGSVSEGLCSEPGHHWRRPQNDLSANVAHGALSRPWSHCALLPKQPGPTFPCRPAPRRLESSPKGVRGRSCIGRRPGTLGRDAGAGGLRRPGRASELPAGVVPLWARSEPWSWSWWKRGPGPCGLPEVLTLSLVFQVPSSAQNTPGTASPFLLVVLSGGEGARPVPGWSSMATASDEGFIWVP